MVAAKVIDIDIPKSEEAERETLGSIMIDPQRYIEVAGILTDANDFFLLRHRIIWQAMTSIKGRDEVLDHITLADSLEKSGDLETIGGRAYLHELSNGAGTSTYASVYARLVHRVAIRRKMLTATDKMIKLVKDESLDISSVRSQADEQWLAATSLVTSTRGAWAQDVASEYYEYFEQLLAGNVQNGLKTGLSDVDSLVCGLSPSQLIILAGRPGMGKSAAMDNIALNIAKGGTAIFYASSERSMQDVMKRMISIWTGINSIKIQNGNLSAIETSSITKAIAEIAKLPIYFEDSPMPTIKDIQVQADWMIKRHDCKLILLDGMYRAKTGIEELDRKDITKYGRIALDLKTMARTLNVPVLATHQLNRSLENRQNKRPNLSDLRESGRIEEEADKVIFLYRDELYNKATEFPNGCEWIVAKHRNGPLGSVNTYYNKTCTKFSNATVVKTSLLDDHYAAK